LKLKYCWSLVLVGEQFATLHQALIYFIVKSTFDLICQNHSSLVWKAARESRGVSPNTNQKISLEKQHLMAQQRNSKGGRASGSAATDASAGNGESGMGMREMGMRE